MPKNIGADIASSLDAMSRNVKKAVREVEKDAEKFAREAHDDQARQAAGSDRRYSGLKAPLKIKAKHVGDGVEIRPFGPWKIAEEGAAPHSLVGGRVKHGHHPGTASTQGQGRWTKAEKATVEKLDKSVPDRFDKAVADGFKA